MRYKTIYYFTNTTDCHIYFTLFFNNFYYDDLGNMVTIVVVFMVLMNKVMAPSPPSKCLKLKDRILYTEQLEPEMGSD